MSDVPQVWIGTCPGSEKLEIALEYSIRKNASGPVSIQWMKADAEPLFTGWRNQPKLPAQGSGQWWTPFTCFRYAVPELSGWTKAIYLDSDMVVLGDIYELWRMAMPKPWVARTPDRTDVSLIDGSKLEHVELWPRLEVLRSKPIPGTAHGAGGITGPAMRDLLRKLDALSPTLPEAWNQLDLCVPGSTKIVHYTRMQTQPGQPFPGVFPYIEKHRDPAAVELFWTMLRDAQRDGFKCSAPGH